MTIPMSFDIIMSKKQNTFSGQARNRGIEIARKQSRKRDGSDIICYLDTDDILLPGHLSIIAREFNEYKSDWTFFDDLAATNPSLNYRVRSNVLEQGRVGTSAIAHRIGCNVRWQDGYGHDWKFIEDLFSKYPNFKKGGQNGYVVCHIPGQIDF
jgi:glycosyltransferase involved in cell wall biosynthesis